jgi:hypothetical protein
MLPPAPHSIRRQVLEVELEGSEADALALQRSLPSLSARVLAPAIAEVLDRCAPAEDWIRIERLEIDAGNVTWERLEQDLPAALSQALALGLEAALTAQGVVAGAKGENGVGGEPGWRRSTAAQSLDEALAYFLEYGSLPSACHLAPGMSFEQTLLTVWQAQSPAGGGHARCAPVLARVLGSERARERLCAQFSAQLMQQLLTRMTGHSAQALASILSAGDGAGAALAPDAARQLERRRWQALFARAAGSSMAPLAELAQAAMVQPAPAGVCALLDPCAPGVRRAARQVDKARGEQSRAAGILKRADVPHPDADEGIFIHNAGLVLLHPFLGRLFEALGLGDGERLLQPDRALHLLHYLASGNRTAPEYELVLPKLLCNVPLTHPVAPDIVLSEPECAECDALLAAVVGHWGALRSTGADGLRAAFLLRNGKLSRRDGDWLLQVEPETADILLNQLPWGISPVKLGWMDRLLWVEWA